jgi:hypothetical protein
MEVSLRERERTAGEVAAKHHRMNRAKAHDAAERAIVMEDKLIATRQQR